MAFSFFDGCAISHRLIATKGRPIFAMNLNLSPIAFAFALAAPLCLAQSALAQTPEPETPRPFPAPPPGWNAPRDPAAGGIPPSPPPPYIPTPRLPADRAERKPDTSKALLLPAPLRGGFGLDTSSFTYSEGDFSALSMALVASVPISRLDFVDARLPLGLTLRDRSYAALGNIELGYHRVFRPKRRLWLTLGASLALPMMSSHAQGQNNYEAPAAAMAYYRLPDYFPDTLPVGLQFGGEYLAGPFVLRGELKMVLGFPVGRNDSVELFLPHALEIQFGQRIGLGLRVQGVGLPSFSELDMAHSLEGHLYQVAVEPFFALEYKPMYMRLGMMMPLDEPLGPPFGDAWGFRMGLGVRLE